ncbi:hypothetical protein AAFF_G00230570 [Aldrovandia affinis]|uniref:Fibronectin type-III domain-containing protein n=1 Tax=Aldrovandia affinis TaxID=143900 RepID=A0AAD7W474_9TELE|nr:hypothetical protein AAFF_G00230570 [Aldrovandia affinis]
MRIAQHHHYPKLPDIKYGCGARGCCRCSAVFGPRIQLVGPAAPPPKHHPAHPEHPLHPHMGLGEPHHQGEPQRCSGSQNATFTVQYLPKFRQKFKPVVWNPACPKTSDMHCDLTGCDLHYLGVYLLRVRASCVGQNSVWVQLEFCPDRHANLGPPSGVLLIPGVELLDLHISDPLTSKNTSMKEYYSDLYYHILYWKYAATDVADYRRLNTSNNVVTLDNLEPWTVYCVRVQSRYNYYNKISSFSDQQCQQTTGTTPFWLIFLWFLASLVLCFLCVLVPSYGLLKFYRLVKVTFFPSYQLPDNIQEYLCDSSPASDRPRLLTPESEVEVCCDNLDVCPVVIVPEIHAPPDAVVPPPSSDPDAPPRHSRQGSGDSGVYSTEGGSGQLGSAGAVGVGTGAELVTMVPMRAESGTEMLSSAPGGRGLKCHPPNPSIWAAEDVLEECV